MVVIRDRENSPFGSPRNRSHSKNCYYGNGSEECEHENMKAFKHTYNSRFNNYKHKLMSFINRKADRTIRDKKELYFGVMKYYCKYKKIQKKFKKLNKQKI